MINNLVIITVKHLIAPEYFLNRLRGYLFKS